MKKYTLILLLCVFFFAIGSMWGKYNFDTSNAYTLDKPIKLISKTGTGVLPKATELYFHSSAHSQTTYFAFISVPEEIGANSIRETSFDHYNGIKLLKVSLVNLNE